jgi:hypothetical protein
LQSAHVTKQKFTIYKDLQPANAQATHRFLVSGYPVKSPTPQTVVTRAIQRLST